MKKRIKAGKIIIAFFAIVVISLNVFADTPPDNSGYWDYALGRPPHSHTTPEEPSRPAAEDSGGQAAGGSQETSGGTHGSGSGGTQGSGGGGAQGSGGEIEEESGSASEEENEEVAEEKPGGTNNGSSGGTSSVINNDNEETEAERRHREALEAIEEADKVLGKFNSLYNEEKAKYYTANKDKIEKARDLKAAAEAVLRAETIVDSLPHSTVGDPVFITNGTFRIDDVDEKFIYGVSEFEVTRKLSSSEYPDGLFGKNWFTNLDSRIIWGKSKEGLDFKKSLLEYYKPKFSSLYWKIKDGGIEPYSCTALLNLYYKLDALDLEIKKFVKNILKDISGNRYTDNRMSQIVSELPVDHFILIDEDGSLNVFRYNGYYDLYTLLNGNDKWAQEKDNRLEINYLDGTVKTYDEFGQIMKIKDRYESSIQFVYDAVGNGRRNVKSIRHKEKDILSFEYNDSNTISSIINLRTGKKRNYEYDDNNSLIEMHYENKSYKFAYDEAGDISRIIKPDGSFIAVNYVVEGNSGKKRVSTVKDESGAVEKFEGDYSSGKMTYTDADGVQYHYEFAGGNITMQDMEDGTCVMRTYSVDGKVATKKDEYGTVSYGYDSYGNMISADYSDGTSENWMYKQPYNLLGMYKDRDKRTTNYEYDSNGSLLRITRNDICIQKMEYNSMGQIIKAEGMYLNNSYTYDENNYSILSDRYGNYTYDSHGNLASYSTKDGRTWTCSYSDDGDRITVVTPEKLKTVYEYNNREDLVSVMETDLNDGNSRSWRYEYDKRHLLEKIYSGFAENESEAKRRMELSASYEYTAGARIESVIYWNTGKAVHLDCNGIKHTVKYKNGLPYAFETYYVDSEGNPLGEIFTTGYSQTFVDGKKKDVFTDEKGKSSYALYDRNGNVLEYGGTDGWKLKNEYSAEGFVVLQKNIAGGNMKYTYDAINGNISSIQQGDAKIEQYEYNDCGKLVHSETQNGFIQDFIYEENEGQNKVCIDSNRGKTIITTDVYGRVQIVSMSDANGEVILEQKVEYTNDGTVELSKGEEKKIVKMNAWGEVVKDMETGSSYHYDQNGRCLQIESIDAPVHIAYNAHGLVSEIRQGNRFQNYHYNAKGNLIKIEDPLGICAQYEYDSTGENLIHSKERGMPEKKYEYDEEDRLKKYYEGNELVMSYSYDEVNGSTTFTDAKGNCFVQKTDGYGRIIQETDRTGKNRTVEYDDEEGVMKVTDFNGQAYRITQSGALNAYIVQYQDGKSDKTFFNAAGSIMRTESDGISESYTYDSGQHLVEFRLRDREGYNVYNNRGQRTGLEIEDEKIEYEYDEKNRVISIDALDYHVDIFYDEFGNDKLYLESSGAKTEFKYDEIGRLISTTGYDAYGALIFMEALVYGEDGKIACSINEEGFIKVFEYDGRGRVKKVQLPYTQELEDNFARQLEECGKTSKEYSRKKIQMSSEMKKACEDVLVKSGQSRFRLNCDNPVWTQEYEYDANGNRIKCTAPTGTLEYEYDAENRLVKINGKRPVTFQYDANGNLISQKSILGEKKWTYGQNNRPISFESTEADGTRTTAEYMYDTFGRRVVADENATLYDGVSMNPLYEWHLSNLGYESDFRQEPRTSSVRFRSIAESGNKQTGTCSFDRLYIYANGRLLGQRNRNCSYSSGVSETNYSFMSDMRNSIRAVTDSRGNKIGKMTYDMDGTMFFSDARKVSQDAGFASTLGLDHGFVGKKYDTVAGAYNFGFRDYTPNTATFTTEDPIRDGMNWYSYCSGDPVNFVDLWGLENNSIYRMGMPSEYWNDNSECINNIYGALSYSEVLKQDSVNDMNYLKSNDPIKVSIVSKKRKYKTTVVVIRPHDGNGDEFNSERFIVKNDGITADVVFHDMVGANCAVDLRNSDCFTEPDGWYYYTTEGLIPNGDGTFDSLSYHNVLKHQTKDKTIPKEIRDKINKYPADFLDHPNQFKTSKKPYRDNLFSRSAGCTIGKDGQTHHNEYMRILLAGVSKVEDIEKLIYSYNYGEQRKCEK